MAKTIKTGLLIAGIVCAAFLSACASAGGTTEDGKTVASRPGDFEWKKYSGWGNDPDSVSVFGFAEGKTFASVNIPSKIRGALVTDIAERYANLTGWVTFQNQGITDLVIPESVKSISNGAFKGNKLTRLILPHGLERIENEAFADNEIAELVIPDTVYEIGPRAFANNKLASVTLSTRTSILGEDAFAGNELTEPIVVPDTVHIIQTQNIRFDVAGSGLSRSLTADIGGRDSSLVEIPSAVYGIPVIRISKNFASLSELGRRNIGRNSRIGKLVLPETLQAIENGAFAFCDVEEVVAPNEYVQGIWTRYYTALIESERTADQQAYNRRIENLRNMIDTLEKMGQ